MKRYYRKQKPFQMNIERDVDIFFEPFFQVSQSYHEPIQYKVSRSVPTKAQIQKIRFLWKLDIYPYNMIEADVIESL